MRGVTGLSHLEGLRLGCEGQQHSLRPSTMDIVDHDRATVEEEMFYRERYLSWGDGDDYLDIVDHERDAMNEQDSSLGT